MNPDPDIAPLVQECQQLQEDSTYTAEVHYGISSKLLCRAFFIKLVPAIVTVSGIILTLSNIFPNISSWIALITGSVTLFAIITEPEKRGKDHLAAAKNYTVLKHDARALHESYKGFMSAKDFFYEVKRLRDRYGSFVQNTPATDDEKAWEKARAKIKSGVHEADFRKK